MAKDPVCGMYVNEKTATLFSVRDGTTYYFCSSSCKEQFDAPAKTLRKEKMLTALAWSIGIPAFAITFFYHFRYDYLILLVLATAVQFVSGMKFYRGLWDALKSFSSNMDTLVAVGTSTAYFYSTFTVLTHPYATSLNVYFDVSTLIIALIRTGSLIEELIKDRASSSVRKLMEMKPSTANVVRNGVTETVPVEEVESGDLVVVKPGEKVPVDGVIAAGSSEVDQSMITGESMPVAVSEGSKVFEGTINTVGNFTMKATTVGSDSTISKMIELVLAAKEGRAPAQRMADRVASYFVPLVVSVAVLSSLLWFFAGNAGISIALLIFVSVVVIACPCAMGIATPAAFMMGANIGAENGILIKSGDALEMSKNVSMILFDKTGTITRGMPKVANVKIIHGRENELLSVALSLEKMSEHPIGKAIATYAEGMKIGSLKVDGFVAVPGMGLKGFINGKEYIAGNLKMAGTVTDLSDEVKNAVEREEDSGRSAIIVACSDHVLGIIAVEDEIKENVKDVIGRIRAMNIEVGMVTGDNRKAAERVARAAGIEKVYANLMPEQKEDAVNNLRRKGYVVAMVGDGINDAPALAAADLGIAIGTGTDIAKATGDIILIKGNIEDVLVALRIGRKTIAKVRQNIFWAFAYNSMLIPVAAGILVPLLGLGIYLYLPILGAMAMAFSSTTVVLNSLLMRWFDPRRG